MANDDDNSPDEASEVSFREVRDVPADSSLGSMLADSAVSAGAAYARMLGALVGAGWRRTIESPLGHLVRHAVYGAVEAAARESAPLRATAGRWSQEQITRVSALLAPAILRAIDVDAVVAQVDSGRLASEIGTSIAEHLDLNAMLADIDIDALLEEVDIEAIIERVDVEALSRRIRIGALMVESTGEAAGTAISMARRQALDTNEAILRSMGRILGRRAEEGEGDGDEDTPEEEPLEDDADSA